jgi:hypothetical protein
MKVEYYLNIKNGNIICCGSVCSKKFKLDKKEMTNKTLEKIFKLKKPYNEYKQFSNIGEYLDYAKDELIIFMSKEIESSKYNNLIIMLENLFNVKKLYSLDIFDSFIDLIKEKIIALNANYIESELREDMNSLYPLMNKFKKLENDYRLKKPSIDLFKSIIEKITDHHVTNYCGYNTPPYQKKFDELINKIQLLKKQTGKSAFLEEFLVSNHEKIKAKIESIRHQNFLYDKDRYERAQEYKRRLETWKEKNPKKYYF